MLNLRQVEIFREVMRCRTTVGAARALAISQPAVSNAVKSMEAQLGFRLFDRIGNRLVPTAEANVVFRDSDPIFLLYRSFHQKVRDLKDTRSGALRLLATPPVGNAIVPAALRAFLARRPKLHVFFDVRRMEGVIEGVETGFADLGLALVPDDRPALARELIRAGEMVCVFAPGNPLAARERIAPADLVGQPLIGFEHGTRLGALVKRAFLDLGPPPEPVIEVRYSNTACLLAESGVGVAIVDAFTAVVGDRYDLECRPLEPRVPVEAYAVYQKTRSPKRLVRAFIDSLKEAEAPTMRRPRAAGRRVSMRPGGPLDRAPQPW